ncbi:MAG TPA: hypothetical protein VKE74_04935, partial [Gemmataceae bacterium]|nr:hypothetical protein [Gemmataceae bacterium]
DLKNQVEQQAKKNDPNATDPKKPKLTPEDIKNLAEKSKDLSSPDPKARKEAEQAFDEKLGKEEREKLQKEMADQLGDPEAKAQQIKEKLEQIAKNGTPNPKGVNDPTVPGRMPPPKLEAMKEDARNRLKTAELQLEKFAKNKDNKAIMDENKWTREDLERIINSQRKEVDNLKRELSDLEQGKVPGEPTTNLSEGRKVDPRSTGTAGPGGASGTGAPAPGYDKAQEKFGQGAIKVPAKR